MWLVHVVEINYICDMEGEVNKKLILPTEPVEGKAFAEAVPATETKVCECCGKEKPLTDFYKRGHGYRKICKLCQAGETGASERFKQFTSRELYEELRRRGYKGKLQREVIETLDS